ncbi:hypothetical protein BDK51DRAFT_30611 [Blyttiomyces helicus]|uniref:Uncharacterized protein n=1 Tax=Blyttiomyces helicus TaxID=388810 RepID=A0A4P9WGZ8_9FUNG|nr:hypothetical protein BDK51DRAFT_30611 [Blyttiomyces helicus]|eukprot:RKO91994.1 hypothetical protein BDK51DRAFT_30611 [Blyttiomyces helicus]
MLTSMLNQGIMGYTLILLRNPAYKSFPRKALEGVAGSILMLRKDAGNISALKPCHKFHRPNGSHFPKRINTIACRLVPIFTHGDRCFISPTQATIDRFNSKPGVHSSDLIHQSMLRVNSSSSPLMPVIPAWLARHGWEGDIPSILLALSIGHHLYKKGSNKDRIPDNNGVWHTLFNIEELVKSERGQKAKFANFAWSDGVSILLLFTQKVWKVTKGARPLIPTPQQMVVETLIAVSPNVKESIGACLSAQAYIYDKDLDRIKRLRILPPHPSLQQSIWHGRPPPNSEGAADLLNSPKGNTLLQYRGWIWSSRVDSSSLLDHLLEVLKLNGKGQVVEVLVNKTWVPHYRYTNFPGRIHCQVKGN